MKKLTAILMALVMMLTMAVGALAEKNDGASLMGGVKFDMDMQQVMDLVNLPNPEIDRERTRGGIEFFELEYENVLSADGFKADLKFIFVGNGLVAIHVDMADGTNYSLVKAVLEGYGKAVPFDAEKIGNARYVIDDDGDLKDCREMIEAEGMTFVLEQDRDGDVDVTLLDPTAAYINN